MKTRKLSGNPIVIMITNNKGGCGKTSECIELAYLFGEKYKVLTIDMDPQCNLSLYSDADLEQKTIQDILDVNFSEIEEGIQHTSNYDIIPGSRALVNASKIYLDSDDEYLLKEIVGNLDYDFIFLDSAPAQSMLSTMEYIAADYVIGVTEADDGSLIGIKNIKEDISKITKRRNPGLKFLGIILNKYDRTNVNKLAVEQLDEMAEDVGCKPFKTVIRASKKSYEAKLMRTSVALYDKKNNIVTDNRELVKEIISRISKDGRM